MSSTPRFQAHAPALWVIKNNEAEIRLTKSRICVLPDAALTQAFTVISCLFHGRRRAFNAVAPMLTIFRSRFRPCARRANSYEHQLTFGPGLPASSAPAPLLPPALSSPLSCALLRTDPLARTPVVAQDSLVAAGAMNACLRKFTPYLAMRWNVFFLLRQAIQSIRSGASC